MPAWRRGLWLLVGMALAAWLAPRHWTGSNPGDSSVSTLEQMRQSGVLRVGYANEAPFAYFDSSRQRLTGEAPEVARVVLAQLGVTRIEGVLTDFGSLIPGLQAGRFDLIAAGMYVTPERCRQVLFSNPTYAIGEAFIVAAGNPRGLHSYEDLIAQPSATLGVVSGTVEVGYARKLGLPEARMRVLPDPPSALAAVAAGRIDAYAGTALTVQDLLQRRQQTQVERAAPFTDPQIDGKAVRGYGAFALRAEDAALRQLLNDQLAGFIGSAPHLKLVSPFGFSAAERPQGMTAQMLCAGQAP